MVRNTPWMLWFIDEMWAQDQLVAPKTWNMLFKYEQRAFHYLYQSQIWRKVVKGDAYPKSNTVRARTKVVNACVFNSQPAFYKDSDLLVHLAGLKGTVKCMWFRYYYKISFAAHAHRPGTCPRTLIYLHLPYGLVSPSAPSRE